MLIHQHGFIMWYIHQVFLGFFLNDFFQSKFVWSLNEVREVNKWRVTVYQIYQGKPHSHNIENVFPAFKYNAEKEQKNEWEAKQKELARIEEAKKAEEEKGISY